MYAYIIFIVVSVAVLTNVLRALDRPHRAGKAGIWSVIMAALILFGCIMAGAEYVVGYVIALLIAYSFRGWIWNLKRS